MCDRAKTLTAIIFIGTCLLFAPLPCAAQQAEKTYRIGILSNAPESYEIARELISQFRDGLRSLGYVAGRNVEFLYRYPSSMAGRKVRLPLLAKALAALKPDVIFTFGWPAIGSAQKATRTIPVVVGVGLNPTVVKDFSHPGANITGLSSMAEHLVGKQLQIFREAVPGLKKVALLWNSQNRNHPRDVEDARRAAHALGMTLFPVPAGKPAGFAPAFEKMADERVGGVIILRDGLFVNSRPQLSNLATRHRIPSMFGHPSEAEDGGLMAYGTNLNALFRRAATYVDKILKGAKPSELPVEQPTQFELVVNLRTAKALGITVPPSILLRADKVIE